mmetsp:Transcript_17660/g.22879  ORF Transcript_17660/g.22879 Transcript_17660/m.22879 type:complete len:135 (+) Transcript_17660:98-502(+)
MFSFTEVSRAIQIFFVLNIITIMPPSAAEAFVFSSSPLATGLGRRSMLKKPYLPPPSFFKNGGDQRCVNPYCQECPPPSFLCSVIGDSSSADKDISTFGQVLQQNDSFNNSRGPVYGVHQRVAEYPTRDGRANY